MDNPLWGAPRIHGELLKLGIDIAQSTVAKYMSQRCETTAVAAGAGGAGAAETGGMRGCWRCGGRGGLRKPPAAATTELPVGVPATREGT